MTTKPGMKCEGLGKRYGDLWALRDLSIEVPSGTVLGLLGHNGAGKTTALKILTTLATPTEGRAEVAGFDAATHGQDVRRSIGVAAQAATVDGLLSAQLNLEMVARLYGMAKAAARKRAGELLERVNLADVGKKLVKEFSGGMRRRLDLAAALVASPAVVFLDEPTTGLDPRSRNELWDLLRDHVKGGATLILTTQYLEEADRLADDIVVLDHGKVAAHGSPSALKQQIGGDRLVCTVKDAVMVDRARGVLEAFAAGPVTVEPELRRVIAPLRGDARLVEIVRALDAAKVEPEDIARREVTLDDVFLTITTSSTDSRKAA